MAQSKDNPHFHQWLGLAEKWISSEDSFDQDYPSKPSKEGKGVAEWLIQDVFDLELEGGSTGISDVLAGYDIRNRDAYDMIKLSLAPKLIDGQFYECYADEEGKIKFHLIGKSGTSLSSKILYSFDTSTLELQCDAVMVEGYDPPPKRFNRDTRDLLTFANSNIMSKTDSASFADVDADGNKYPLYHLFGDVLGPEACAYNYLTNIEFGGFPDKLENTDPEAFHNVKPVVYDPEAHEKILSYVYKIKVGFWEKGYTNVEFVGRSPRYQVLTNMGKLQTRNWVSDEIYKADLCKEGETTISYPASDVGVELPRSDEKKFMGVREVYIYGYRLKSIRPYEAPESDGAGGYIYVRSSTDFRVSLDTTKPEPFKLSEGTDYLVLPKDEQSGIFKLVFICNVADSFLGVYGGDASGAGTTSASFKIDASSSLFERAEAGGLKKVDVTVETGEVSGYLRDARVTEEYNNTTPHTEMIFPTGEGESGYVVKKIVAVYDWDNPSIQIEDLRRSVLSEASLKQDVSIEFFPIIIKDPPTPVAVNGQLLDRNQIRPDYSSTAKVQNWDETEYSRAYSSLEKSDVKVNMPFAEPDDCKKISTAIKDIQNDNIKETTYMCEPGAEPVLGELINNQVINSIDYSYQDSSQYLISVNAGPKWRGVGSWGASVYQMKTERLQAEGVIQQVSENNVSCDVFVNRFGVMECVNGTKYKLEKGDEVSVTIFNNPVSL